MKIKKTLQNPFVLVAQGFVVGTILFFSTSAPDEEAPRQASSAVGAVVAAA